MKVYRLSKIKYANELSGYGASRYNTNRWNSQGTFMIYTATSRALATAEVFVHLSKSNLPDSMAMVVIEIPAAVKPQTLPMSHLPETWDSWPPADATRQLGDKFIHEMKSCVLKVPSAAVKGDFNYLINPYHPDFKKLKIKSVEPYAINERFFQDPAS